LGKEKRVDGSYRNQNPLKIEEKKFAGGETVTLERRGDLMREGRFGQGYKTHLPVNI